MNVLLGFIIITLTSHLCAKKIEKTILKTTECPKNGCFLKGENKKTKARSKEKAFDTS